MAPHHPNAGAGSEIQRLLRKGHRPLRRECLDHLLILNQRHLEAVLVEYIDHYNHERPHRSLAQQSPEGHPPRDPPEPSARIARIDRLGGLIHEYKTAA